MALTGSEATLAIVGLVLLFVGNASGGILGDLAIAYVLAFLLALWMVVGDVLMFRASHWRPRRNPAVIAFYASLPFTIALVITNVAVSRSLTKSASVTVKTEAAVLTLTTVVNVVWMVVTYILSRSTVST